jgi:hypothetical protein
VQLRGRRRQALPVQRRAIPDAPHPTRPLPPQRLAQGDDVARIHCLVLAMNIQLTRGRDGAEGGAMVTGPPFPQDGGLPQRRLGAHHPGPGMTAGCLDDEEGRLRRFRPLWSTGHVSVRQRAMAASSRCRARRIGF